MRDLPNYWDDYFGGRYNPDYEQPTGLAREEFAELTERLTTYPAGFHIHPKVKKLLEQREEMGTGKKPLDYGMAEALAFASLVRKASRFASAVRIPDAQHSTSGTRCSST